MHDTLDELCAIADRHATRSRRPGPLPRVTLYRGEGGHRTEAGVYLPVTAFVLRGSKELTTGDRQLRCDPASYFTASVELPASGCIRLDRPDETFLGVSLDLDGDKLAAMLPDADVADEAADAGFAITPVTPGLLDAWLRLLRLLDTPAEVAVLGPLYEQEILFRLLQGPQGGMLRQFTRADSRLSRVRRAIAMIREGYDRPIRAEALAEAAGMSPASFRRHFRAATAMSPLQYQKQLRLHEARRLVASGHEVAASGYAVGYESASQFSREYARMFGEPPSRDARGMARPLAA